MSLSDLGPDPIYVAPEPVDPRKALLNELMLDIIANTDCSWEAASAAIAFWELHYKENTHSVYGVVEYGDEKPNILYDNGKRNRSLKVGATVADQPYWFFTVK